MLGLGKDSLRLAVRVRSGSLNYFVRQWSVFVTQMLGFRPVLLESTPEKIIQHNSENNDNSLLMCFQSSPWQKPMGDMFGVCLLYFSLVPPGNMYTYVHIDSYAHEHFNSVLSNSRKTTHGFLFGKR